MANKLIKVTNDGVGTVVYALPELRNLRRVFNSGETKEIPVAELTALWQLHGGAELIKHELRVQDEEWVESMWPDVPVEYFWERSDIERCLRDDSLELLEDTLAHAPGRVLALIKLASWSIPISDLNKMALIKKYLNFDVQAAIRVMAPPADAPEAAAKPKTRLRERVRKED